MFEVTESEQNKDLLDGETRLKAQRRYLKLYGKFKSKYKVPKIYTFPQRRLEVWDFPRGNVSLKLFGAERLIAESDNDVFGYACPRVGHASLAIAKVCEDYGKRVVFFCPAASQVSDHQAVCATFKSAELRFCKVASMKTMNAYIRRWADEYGYEALPFGLSGSPLPTSALVWLAKQVPEPRAFYCAVSTGAMVRGLQIGWPNADAHGIAVARNIKDGEKGDAYIDSSLQYFLQSAKIQPPFESTANYDAKCYEIFSQSYTPIGHGRFINVASDRQADDRLVGLDTSVIRSERPWGDLSAFETGVKEQCTFIKNRGIITLPNIKLPVRKQ